MRLVQSTYGLALGLGEIRNMRRVQWTAKGTSAGPAEASRWCKRQIGCCNTIQERSNMAIDTHTSPDSNQEKCTKSVSKKWEELWALGHTLPYIRTQHTGFLQLSGQADLVEGKGSFLTVLIPTAGRCTKLYQTYARIFCVPCRELEYFHVQ